MKTLTAVSSLVCVTFLVLVAAPAGSAAAAACVQTHRLKGQKVDALATATVIARANFTRTQKGLEPLYISPALTRAAAVRSLGPNPYGPDAANGTLIQSKWDALAEGCGYAGALSTESVTFHDESSLSTLASTLEEDEQATVVGVSVTTDGPGSYYAVGITGADDDSGYTASENVPPRAKADHAVVAYNGSVTIPVTRNDSGSPGSPPVVVAAVASKGSVELSMNTLTYDAIDDKGRPVPPGHATITYTIANVYGAAATGAVTVTIKPNGNRLTVHVPATIGLSAVRTTRLHWDGQSRAYQDDTLSFRSPDDQIQIEFRVYRVVGGRWLPLGQKHTLHGYLGGAETDPIFPSNGGVALLPWTATPGRYVVILSAQGQRATTHFTLVP